MTTGISEEEKKKMLESINRKGNCSFEAPTLNQEVILGMTEDAVKRDAFFASHQNLAMVYHYRWFPLFYKAFLTLE